MIKPKKKTPAKKNVLIVRSEKTAKGSAKTKKKSGKNVVKKKKKAVQTQSGKVKKKAGAKLKIKPFLEVAKKTINKLEGELFILTDEELVFVINEQLEPVDKICQSTFEAWKKKAIEETEVDKERSALFREFSSLIKKAMIIEKTNLFEKFQSDKQAWQRWAWIIERKFSEWNLKHVSEIENKSPQLPTKIVIVSDNEK